MYISTLITDPVYMEYIQYVLSGLVMITMAIVPFFIENHTKKYLETKGANLAQKEDLAELTTIINQVKSKFETDSAILKAKLDVVSGTALNLKNEERKAIIALNESYFKWISVIRGKLITSSIVDIDKHENALSDVFSEMVYKEAAFVLFVGNNKLLAEYTSLKIKSMGAFVQKRHQIATNIKLNLMSLKSVVKTDDDIKYNKILMDEINNHVDEFNKDMLKQCKDVIPMEIQFQETCREFIYADS